MKDSSKEPFLVSHYHEGDKTDGSNDAAEKIDVDDSSNDGVILYRRRFFQLFSYFTLLFFFGSAQNAYAPIQDVVKDIYDVTAFQVNFLALLVPIANIPLSFVSGFCLNRFGFRKTTLLFSAIPAVLGGWLRFAASHSYIGVVFGQFLQATGQPFGLAGSTLLSEKWFAEKERAIATAVGGLSTILGSVVSSLMAPKMFKKVATKQEHQQGFSNWMLVLACCNSFAFLLCLLLKDEPPTPPSLSAAKEKTEEAEEKKLSLKETIAIPLKNPHFLMLMFLFGCGYGSLGAITTLINQILSPIGYPDNEIGTIGAALGTGILGALVIGTITGITKAYKIILKSCAAVAGCCFFCFILSAYLDAKPTHMWALFGSLAGVGFFGVPLVPLTLELGVESLYPLNEGIATSFLWLSANLTGLAVVLIATFMESACSPGINLVTQLPSSCVYAPFSMFHSVIFLGCVFGLAFLLGLAFHGPLLRLEYERKQHRALSMAQSTEGRTTMDIQSPNDDNGEEEEEDNEYRIN